MEDEIHLEEFHRSSFHRQLVRKSTITENEFPFLSQLAKKAKEQGDEKRVERKKGSVKASMLNTKSASFPPSEAKSPTRPRLGSVGTYLIQEPLRVAQKTNSLPEEVKIDILKKAPLAESTPKELQDKLTASLSPSPFISVGGSEEEAGLDQLVAASKGDFILTPFYGREIMSGSAKHWKKALKDHILHTLQSICIIKKLKPIPSELLLKKSVTLSNSSGSIGYHLTLLGDKTIVFDLDETLAHCVTDNVQKADQTIEIALPSGEVVKVSDGVQK